MIRIFSTLALFAVLCVAAAMFLGLGIGDLYQPADTTFHETLRWATVHRLTGIAAALVVILVNSIVVTYFIGTSRWCREVIETYGLDRELFVQSQTLKRRTFPWAVAGMLAVVGVAALGGAADPGTGMRNTADWVTPHFLAAMSALAFICLAFFVQATNIRAHNVIIHEIADKVRQIRLQRGLEV